MIWYDMIYFILSLPLPLSLSLSLFLSLSVSRSPCLYFSPSLLVSVPHSLLLPFWYRYPEREAMVTDACVPLSRLSDLISLTREALDKSWLPAPIIAHAGESVRTPHATTNPSLIR